MGSIGAPEIVVILLVALIVLGPQRLPEAARQAGRALAEFRRITSGFQDELRDALIEPQAPPPPEVDVPQEHSWDVPSHLLPTTPSSNGWRRVGQDGDGPAAAPESDG